MAIKDKSVTISFFLQDAANGGGKTGDNANLTLRIIADGTASAPTNSSSEIDATGAKGWYKLVVTAGENSGAMMALAVQSSTTDIYSAGAAWTNEHNVAAVSEDETAADNLELQYDGTGLSGDTFPSTQLQVESQTTAVGGGAAVNTAADTFIADTGTVTANTVADTDSVDGVRHTIEDVGGVIRFDYEFDIGSDGVPASCKFTGYAYGVGDDINVFAYDWDGASYDQVGTIVGSMATDNMAQQFDLLTKHVGTGSDTGTVRIRFEGTGLSAAVFAIDQMICSYTQSVTGIPNGTTLTLSGDTSNTNLVGRNWSLVLNGQSISGAYVNGAVSVTGTGTGANAKPYTFDRCEFNTPTLDAFGFFEDCTFKGTFTATSTALTSPDELNFINCASSVAGSSSPHYDLSGVTKTTSSSFRRWSGGVTLTVNSLCTVSVDGVSGGNVTINGTGGTVHVRGNFESIVDNSAGAVTIVSDALLNKVSVSEAVWDVATASYVDAGSFGFVLNSINAAVAATDLTVGEIQSTIGLNGGGLSAIPWNTSWDAEVQSEVTASLNAYDPPTKAELDAGLAGLNDPTAASIADAVWTEAIADHSGTVGSTAEALDGASAPTAAAVADAVWDEAIAGHVTASTFGLVVQSINTTTASTNASVGDILTDTGTSLPAQISGLNDPTVAEIADGVWDELQSGHTTAGTFGKYLDTEVSGVGGGTPPTAAAIADAVWTETLADHSGVSGSTAEALNAAGGSGDPWTTTLPGSYTGSQAGKILADVLVDTGTTIPAQITGLNDFDPASDTVANVTLVGTVTTNTDMRGTDSALLASSAPTNWSDLLVEAVTGKVTTSNPAEGSGSAHTAEDVRDLILAGDKAPIAVTTGSVDNVTLVDTVTTNTDMRGTDGANTVTPNTVVPPSVAQFNARTLLAADYFDPATDTVANVTNVANNADMRGTDSALLASAAPANWSDLIIGTGADLGKVTTSNPSVGGVAHTAEDVRDLILAGDKTPIAVTTGSVDNVILVATTTTNTDMRGTDGANTVVPVDVSSDVTAIKAKTDQLTFTVANQVDSNALTGGGGDDAATVADAVWTELLANHSGVPGSTAESLAAAGSAGDPWITPLPGSYTAAQAGGILAAIDAVIDKLDSGLEDDGAGGSQWTTLALANGSGGGGNIGAGSVEHEVTITKAGQPVDGAEVWVSTGISGTNVVAGTLTTDAFGNATFMLDPGDYYLWVQQAGVNFPNPTSFTVS